MRRLQVIKGYTLALAMLIVTRLVNGKRQTMTSYKINSPKLTAKKSVTGDHASYHYI